MDTLVESGVEKAVIGMPHRGRLNVLSNVVHKPFEKIFAEFQGAIPDSENPQWGNSGDVKYHLGTTYTRPHKNGKSLTISVLANPSHLETVDPVVLGRVRGD